jgi:hypothetical protein
MSNYDASQIGVPYTRVHRIEILYPDAGLQSTAVLDQSEAVKMADGTVRKLRELPSLYVTFDFKNDGSTSIPLINPNDGSTIGSTTLNTAMLNILAVVRYEQLKVV